MGVWIQTPTRGKESDLPKRACFLNFVLLILQEQNWDLRIDAPLAKFAKTTVSTVTIARRMNSGLPREARRAVNTNFAHNVKREHYSKNATSVYLCSNFGTGYFLATYSPNKKLYRPIERVLIHRLIITRLLYSCFLTIFFRYFFLAPDFHHQLYIFNKDPGLITYTSFDSDGYTHEHM